MKVCDFGSINIDYMYEMDHFVNPKETCACISTQINIGGKGLNQALACKKAGIDIRIAGNIGEDGLFIKDYLEENGLDTQSISICEDRTGHAIIQTCNGENCIIIAGGANWKIDKKKVDTILDEYEEGDILILQNEISSMAYIIEKAHEKKMKIYFNVAPMNEDVFAYPLSYVDTLIVNEIEGKALSKCESDNYEDILSSLESMFPKQAILMTVGKDGAYYSKEKYRIFQKAFSVKSVDSTAAGDTFMGFYISSLIHGYSISKSLEIAAKASSVTVQRIGAAQSIPSWEEIVK